MLTIEDVQEILAITDDEYVLPFILMEIFPGIDVYKTFDLHSLHSKQPRFAEEFTPKPTKNSIIQKFEELSIMDNEEGIEFDIEID